MAKPLKIAAECVEIRVFFMVPPTHLECLSIRGDEDYQPIGLVWNTVFFACLDGKNVPGRSHLFYLVFCWSESLSVYRFSHSPEIFFSGGEGRTTCKIA